MKKIALLPVAVVAMLVALLPAMPAHAAPVSYLASTGGGTACTRAAPCAAFQAAADATDVDGQITCLDSGPFSGAPGFGITKSVTIDCAGTAATTFGLSVTGAGVVVRIRNLRFTPSGGGNGINFLAGGTLIVENCLIENFNSISLIGISFRPAAAGSQLIVTDTIITNNGSGSTGGGIVINPQSGATAQVALNRVTVVKNVFGIAVDGTGSSGGINMTISDSVTAGNSQDGIIAVTPSGGAPIGVYVKNTRSANNGGFGIRSIGPSVTVRVDGSSVIGNSTGLGFFSGGALLTAGNNMVQTNGANGAFSGSVGLQ